MVDGPLVLSGCFMNITNKRLQRTILVLKPRFMGIFEDYSGYDIGVILPCKCENGLITWHLNILVVNICSAVTTVWYNGTWTLVMSVLGTCVVFLVVLTVVHKFSHDSWCRANCQR